jgi:toxin ParE1/3/4
MSMPVRWTRRALFRLDHIGDYIAQRNPAADAVTRLFTSGERLADHPEIGRQGRVPGTRELVMTDLPYIIVYRRVRDRLEILSILHTSQRWPQRF